MSNLTMAARSKSMLGVMGFAAFWFDVFRDSTLALLAVAGAVGDVIAVRVFLTEQPNDVRARLMKWWPRHPARLRILAAAFAVSVMWTAQGKWAAEAGRADGAEQALALRTRQQLPRVPIGHSSGAIVHVPESTHWATLETPPVPYDWSTVPADADVLATFRVRMYGGDQNRRTCRAARVRVRDMGTASVAGGSERIPYTPAAAQGELVKILLDRRTVLTSYTVEVVSESAHCPINVQGEIGAEYR